MYELKHIKTNPTDMKLEELVEDYAKNKQMGKAIEDRLKEVKPALLAHFGDRTDAVSGGCSVSVTNRTTVTVDTDILDELCQKKGIEVGNVLYEITPKKTVPEKVLKQLDDYFILKVIRDIDKKGLEKAVNHGLITVDEAESMYVKKTTQTVNSSVESKVAKGMIKVS